MSLYNMLFGENDKADMLLACLNLKRGDVPRYRDCYLIKNAIVIHTRTGGGNRDFYESQASCKANYPEYFEREEPPAGPWNSDLENHPCYVGDSDDDCDCTYADFMFKFPDDYKDDLEALASGSKDMKPSEKWQKLFNDMQSSAA